MLVPRDGGLDNCPHGKANIVISLCKCDDGLSGWRTANAEASMRGKGATN